jgi:hypothetical protein
MNMTLTAYPISRIQFVGGACSVHGEMRNVKIILVANHHRKTLLGRPKHRKPVSVPVCPP